MSTLLLSPHRPVDELTRRRLLGGMGGLGALAVLPGCGAGTAPERPAAAPARIPHRFGSTEVPADPKRVVTIGLVEQDALLAMGVVPVGTTEFFGGHPGAVHPWARTALGDGPLPEVLTTTDDIEFERVAALEPDLVLAVYSGLTRTDYDTLSAIAPTVAPPPGFIDYGVSWQDLTRTVGAAVGRAERAEGIVAGIEDRIAAARRAHPEFVGASAVMAGYEPGLYYGFGSQDPRGRLLADLGFRVPAGIDELGGESYFAEISPERVDLLDTDALVWLVETDDQRAAIEADPLYARLDVAAQGRALFLLDGSDLGAATTFQTVLSLPFLLDGLVPRLAAALDGDPGTA